MDEIAEREFTVTESTVMAIIAAASDYHIANHRNADFEVCDNPVCEAAYQLERETAVYDDWSREQ
jgi:hypothetical protein